MAASYEDRILRVLDYIHDNPAGDLSLDALAEVAAMSRFHWHRVYRALTGETCAQSVRRMRLHLGATRLVKTDAAAAEIAAAVGYPNTASFARAFSGAYGMSPAAFRKAGRLMPPFPRLKTGDYPMHPIEVRTEPVRRLAVIAHQGPYEEIGRSFEAFGAICQSRSLWPQVGPMLAIYLDSPETVPPAELRSYAGGQFHGGGIPQGLEEQTLPGGRTAVLTYKGPYSGIGPAYDTLFGNWLPGSGEEPADSPCFEIYLNNPREVPPEELLTEICLPLKGSSQP
jgi:AraC family transcriptional regulator